MEDPRKLRFWDLELDWIRANYASGTAADHVPVFLARDDVDDDGRRWGLARHRDFYTLYVAERGKGLLVIDSVSYAVARGDVYVTRPGSEHAYGVADRLLLHAIHFSADAFEAAIWRALRSLPGFETLVIDRGSARRLHLDPAAYAEVALDIAELEREWHAGTFVNAHLACALLLRLLVRLARIASGENIRLSLPPSRITPWHEDIASIVQTIDLNYDQRLRVGELAASVHLSHARFTELFKSVMGRVPSDYIRHVRLERAKMLLATTTMPIADIARATGFYDRSHLTSSFRTANRMSPHEFRRNARSQQGVTPR